jgi:hypothetical protein
VVTRQDVEEYVPEPADKRTQAEWDAMTLEELCAEWNSRPQYPLGPPYPQDRNRYARLTKVRSEIFIRSQAKPPDGVTYGSRGKAS